MYASVDLLYIMLRPPNITYEYIPHMPEFITSCLRFLNSETADAIYKPPISVSQIYAWIKLQRSHLLQNFNK